MSIMATIRSTVVVKTDICGFKWAEFIQRNIIDCSLYVGVHKGDVNILRSHVFGDDITVAASLAYQRSLLAEAGKSVVLVSSRIVDEAKGTEWEQSFTRV